QGTEGAARRRAARGNRPSSPTRSWTGRRPVNYLIDTNVISEVRKGDRCNRYVASWYASIDDADIYLSVLVLGEIRGGIERAKGKDPMKARALERWLAAVQDSFADRVLP